ncbi:MAG: protein kinase [Minicystis sp.]
MECPACHSPNIDGARFCAKCGALLPAAADAADPLIGTVVGGRYRISGILGEGGMGRVYTGEQSMGTSVRKVAVKTLLAQYAKDPQVLARFMRECGTVSELEHPNTIKVYDFGQTDSGELYIAMELLSGTSLEAALEKGPLAAERVDHILGQICGSLQEAHDKGIVHRDLKPANIYLSNRAGEEDSVKVLDFGIAKRDEKRNTKSEQKLTQQGTVLGTPPYMSPEQFKGGELDARSDIYSLGVVTYEMLTGRLPFDADTPWAWATQHMTAQPFPFETIPLGSQVPPKMKAAVMRALSKDKNQRQSTVREYFEEFTMGGGPRMSSLPRVSMPDTSGGTAMMPASSGAAGGARTQVGEPIFSGQQPSGRTMVDSGVPAQGGYSSAPGGTAPGASYPSNPGMPQGQQVPTGSGQAYAPTPRAPAQKSNLGLILGGVAVLSVIGIVALVFALKGKGGSGEGELSDAGGIALPEGGVIVVPPDGTDDGGTASIDAGALDAGKVLIPTTGTVKPNTPPVDPKAEAECKAAIGLATGGNVSMAVGHFRNCDGSSKAAARSAIDAAGSRAAARGCPGARDAQAAASIGASSGLTALKGKHCPGIK